MKLRSFGDTSETRKAIYQSIKKGFEERPMTEGRFVKFKISDVQVQDKSYTKKDEKEAKLYDRDLTVPVKGNIELYDKATGNKLGQRKMTLGHLPYMTKTFGSFIGNGTDFSVANQMRLLPGTYTRERTNGEIETQFNVQGAVGFRTAMDPKTAVFKMNIGNNRLPLYPILRKIGISDHELEREWGKDILSRNKTDKTEPVERFYKKIAGFNAIPNLSVDEQGAEIKKHLKGLKLTPEVMTDTLGEPFEHATPRAILKSTGKILKVFRGETAADDRDSLTYKSFHGVEDFLKERIEKDSGKLSKKLAYKLDQHKDLSRVPSSYFGKYFSSIVRGDSRAFPLEEINPLQLYDNMHRSIITGEGGIGSINMVTMDARNVHPSQIGFIDPIRGPESEKIGIDTRFAHRTKKGDDKKIYARYIDTASGKEEYLSPNVAYNTVIAYPGEEKTKSKVRAMLRGKTITVPRSKVKFRIEDPSELFSVYSNLVPMHSATQGNRLLMAGKALSDTLPLVMKEAPIVRSKKTTGGELDFETHYGKKVLAETSPIDGKVERVTPDLVVIKDKGGGLHPVDIFNNYPLSRKTMIHNNPQVQVGDTVTKGQVLADSNYTDKKGTMALGKHLNTAFLPFRGLTFEDGIVISESAADKLTSEQVYKYEVQLDKSTILGKKNFGGYFPTIYKKHQADKIIASGLPRPGTKISKNDPIIMAIKERTLSPTDLSLGRLHKILKDKYEDVSVEWDHSEPGEVVNAVITKDKAKVYVKTHTPAKVGDKLSGRYGNKGVISAIVPDNEMPTIKRTGEKLDAALNPMGIISRINPSQVFEGLLGKIGKEKGTIYRMPGFSPDKYNELVKKELAKHGIPDKEILIDPVEGELKTMVTYPYFYKLSQLSESKIGARDMSSYTSNMQPAKGKVIGGTTGLTYSSSMTPMKGKKAEGGAIKIGADLLANFMAHGARHNMRDSTLVKGQKNDEFWRAMSLGYPLPTPDTPFVYKKFEAMLRGAGANVSKSGNMLNIRPVTDSDVMKLTNGEIKNAKFLSAKTMEPEKGGLFDFGITGGPTGEKWSHLSLAEPMPNPMMESSIKNVLGLGARQFEDVITGKKLLGGDYGGRAIKKALASIDVDKEIASLRKGIPIAKKSAKDSLVKKMKSLIGFRKSGKRPEEMMMTKFPIIPPIYRPVSMLGEGGAITVSDANRLYEDLYHANTAMKKLQEQGMPDSALGEEKLNIYKAIKATSGIGDPISVENKQSQVKGFIRKITGEQPKTGFFFDRLISKTQDLSGRGVAVPDSKLSIDELGLPEKIAWKIYRKFIMKELVTKRGIQALRANEMIDAKDPKALDALKKVMSERPVMMNRAPSLHRFSIMAFNPVLTKNNAIGTSPPITGPYNLDYDGDNLQIFAPGTDEAAREARQKMMPSKNLFSLKDYGAHYKPPHEDIHGLHIASTINKGNAPIKFGSVAEVDAALRAGKIDYDTVVEVDV